MSADVLVIDDILTNRVALEARLRAAYYDVEQASSIAEAEIILTQDMPDVILLGKTPGSRDTLRFCRQIRRNKEKSNTSLIVICAHDDPEGRIEALRAGADDVISHPFDEMTLLARLRNICRARDLDKEMRLRESTSREFGFAAPETSFETAPKIALITGREFDAKQWKPMIAAKFGPNVTVLRPEDALDFKAGSSVPDIFVIPGCIERTDDGLGLLSEMRTRPDTRHCGILFIMPKRAEQQSVIALDLGANDLLHQPFDPREMELRLDAMLRRKRQADHLRSAVKDHLRLAVVDELTGLYNRRYALAHLTRINQRAEETGRSFAVMMLDIDRFKQVNDEFGHAAGDSVLSEIAGRLRDNLRGVDMLARIGGEEFLVAMPETDIDQARGAAERLRRIVEKTPIPISLPQGEQQIDVTLSIGVTMGGERADFSVDSLIAEADTALYESKTIGRNMVTFCRSAA